MLGVVADAALIVDHFKALAFSFRMTYAGPATETDGADLSKFYRLDDEVLPFFPDDVPARKRKTYWRWCKSNSVVDVLISNLDGMLVLLFEVLGLSNPMDPTQYTEAFEKASQDCVAPFVLVLLRAPCACLLRGEKGAEKRGASRARMPTRGAHRVLVQPRLDASCAEGVTARERRGAPGNDRERFQAHRARVGGAILVRTAVRTRCRCSDSDGRARP